MLIPSFSTLKIDLSLKKTSPLQHRSPLQASGLPVAITLQSPFLNVEHQPFSEGEACARQTFELFQPGICYVAFVPVGSQDSNG